MERNEVEWGGPGGTSATRFYLSTLVAGFARPLTVQKVGQSPGGVGDLSPRDNAGAIHVHAEDLVFAGGHHLLAPKPTGHHGIESRCIHAPGLGPIVAWVLIIQTEWCTLLSKTPKMRRQTEDRSSRS